MKKVLLTILCCVLLIGSIPVASFAAVGGGEIAVPFYNNTTLFNPKFTIDEAGVAKAVASYVGKPNIVTSVTVTTKIEKKNSDGTWSIVDIGTPNNTWVDTTQNITLSAYHTVQVSRGTYRAVFDYVVSGTGGADDVEQIIIERTY